MRASEREKKMRVKKLSGLFISFNRQHLNESSRTGSFRDNETIIWLPFLSFCEVVSVFLWFIERRVVFLASSLQFLGFCSNMLTTFEWWTWQANSLVKPGTQIVCRYSLSCNIRWSRMNIKEREKSDKILSLRVALRRPLSSNDVWGDKKKLFCLWQ